MVPSAQRHAGRRPGPARPEVWLRALLSGFALVFMLAVHANERRYYFDSHDSSARLA